MTVHSRHPQSRRWWGRRPPAGDRGSASVELALVAPGLLALLALTILAGRVVLAGATAEHAAAAAARAASLTRNPTQARAAADTAARQSLNQHGVRCQEITVTVDTTGYTVPVGHPATVTVTVFCRVGLADLSLPGTPGARTLTARASSPLDPYRARILNLTQPATPSAIGSRQR